MNFDAAFGTVEEALLLLVRSVACMESDQVVDRAVEADIHLASNSSGDHPFQDRPFRDRPFRDEHQTVRVPADSEVPVAVLEFALAFVLASVLAFDHVVETCLGVVRKTGVAVQAGTSPDFARAAESFAEADLRREMQYFFPHPDFWVSFRGRGQFRFRRYFASVGPNPRFYEFPPRRVAAAPNDIPAQKDI